jgi:tetratricopeptide (TPR) repeat protein
MLRRAWIALLLVPLACGGKKKHAAPAPAPAAAAAAAPDAAPAAPPPPTKEARRAYRQHLAAGRKHGAASEWGEAVVDFDAALAAVPHDARALSELAWAAFNSGDFDKARRAGRESVAATREPRLKASSLYNLGRVEEATARKEQAARLYRESLALRPSATVEARLAGLGQEFEELGAADALPCTAPRAEAELCTCLGAYVDAWSKGDDAMGACESLPVAGLPDWRVVHVQLEQDTETVLLAARGPTGWSVVTKVADVFDPGAFGITEDWKLLSMRSRALGDHTIVELTSEHTRLDNDLAAGESQSEDTTLYTICVVGAAGAPTTCPLQAPIRQREATDPLDFGDGPDDPEPGAPPPPKPPAPTRRSAELRVDLTPDGGANVRLVKGKSDDSLRVVLGPHRLW